MVTLPVCVEGSGAGQPPGGGSLPLPELEEAEDDDEDDEDEDEDEDEDDEDDASAALAATVGAGAPAEDDEEDELEGEGEAFATLPSFPFFLLASGLPPDVPARAASSSRASMRARLAILRSSSAIRSASPAALAAAIFFSNFAIVGMVSALRRSGRRRCRR